MGGVGYILVDAEPRLKRSVMWFFKCQCSWKIPRHLDKDLLRLRPVVQSLAETPNHVAGRTLAYTQSSPVGSAGCRGLFEILTWPYSTSTSALFCCTCLPLRIFTSA